MPTPEVFFKELSDETRLRVLHLLWVHGELCVCELTDALDLSQPKISRHLASLRDAGLVLDTRRGTWAFYRLHPNLAGWMGNVLPQALSALTETAPYRDDRVRCRHLVPREQACGVCPVQDHE